MVLWALFLHVVPAVGLQSSFEEAGHHGWKAWIPGYNYVVATRIVGYTTVKALPGPWTLCGEYARVFGLSQRVGRKLWFLPPVYALWIWFSDTSYIGEIVDEDITELQRAMSKMMIQSGSQAMAGGMSMASASVPNSKRVEKSQAAEARDAGGTIADALQTGDVEAVKEVKEELLDEREAELRGETGAN